MVDGKKGNWKKLLAKLKKVAPVAATVIDTAGEVVGGPAGIALEALARVVAGAGPEEDLDAVATTILSDPALMVRMEELAMERERSLLDNETKRIESVNATMRVEAQAEDKWTRRWRPYFGFIVGTVWGILGLAMGVVIVGTAFGLGDPHTITFIGTAFGDMTVFWSLALAVLGVTAWTRGMEKIERTKKGTPGPTAPVLSDDN